MNPKSLLHPLKSNIFKILFGAGFIVVILSIGGFAPLAHAATYYVDSVGGLDTNSGTSSSTPWQTIAKVNSSTFSPGDNILFKAGDTWREQLTIPSSGNASSSITFGSYGGGAKPIISGADLAAIPASGAAQWTADTPSNMLLWGSDITCNTSPSICSSVGWTGSGVTWPATNFDTINVTASSASNVKQYVAVSPSTQYTFSFQAKAGTLATPQYSVYDATHSANIVSATSYAGSINSSTFSAVSVTFTTPAGCTSIIVYLERDSPGTGTVFATQAQVVQGSSVVANSVYYGIFSANPSQVLRDNVRLNLVASKSTLATGDYWGYSNGQAYYIVYVYDNPIGHTVEASERPYSIYDSGKNYIAVSNIETDKSGGSVTGGDTAVYGTFFYSCNSILLTGITAQWNLGEGIRVDTCTNAEVTQSIAAYNGDSGFEGVASPGLLFDHLTAHDNAQFGSNESSAGIKFNDHVTPVGTNMTVQYSVSYNNGVGQSGAGSWGAGIWADTVATGWTAKYNLVYGNNFEGIRAEADSQVTIVGNVVYGTTDTADGDGIHITGDNSAIPLTNSLVANNTSYENAGPGLFIEARNEAGGCMNNRVVNNIAMGTNVWLTQFGAYFGCENSGTNGSGNVYTNNAFGTPSESLGGGSQFIEWGQGNYYNTYAAWETASGNCGTVGCSHSVEADPLFTSTSTYNFTLASSSPTIDAGLNLGSTYEYGLDPASTWPSNIILDNENSYGSGWDIGAYVYTQTSTPSVAMTAPTANSTVSGAISVTATSSAVAPASISSVQFYLDGSPLGSAVTSSPYAISWNTATATNGSHTLYALATDNYSNTATSTSITVTVANAAVLSVPTSTLNFSLISGVSTISSQSLVITNNGTAFTTLNWSATSTQPWLTFSPSSGSLAGGASSSIFLVANQSGLLVGTYNATATIADSNASSSPQTFAVSFTINEPPPPPGVPQSAFIVPSSVATTTASQASSTVATSITTATTATTTASSSPASPSSLQATINALTAKLQSLETQAGSVPIQNSPSYVFPRNLTLFDTGTDVQMLQKYLNGHGFLVAPSGPGSPSNETTRFGMKTWAALVKLQKSVGVPGTGYFGPVTRAYVNGHE